MKRYQLASVLTATLLVAPLVQLSGQTRFARPDTTPNYSGYQYLDECMAAIIRLKEYAVAIDPVWEDTVSLDTLKLQRPLPSFVVKTAQECISKVDIDTVPFKNVHKTADALLVANRDDDVVRLYGRFVDSIANDSSRESFLSMLNVYMNAVPVRMDKVVDLYNLGLLRLQPDSVVSGLMLRTVVASVSARSGDYTLANQIAKEVLGIADTLSPVYRNSPQYQGFAHGIIFPFISSLMPPEAVDSLAKSTDAYRNYVKGVWKAIFATDAGDAVDPYGKVAPEPTGKFWYSNLGADGRLASISPKPVIEKGKVTMIHFLQGGCHANYSPVVMGRYNGYPSSCWQEIHKTRKILEQYPQINLIVVSRTFGSFGDAPPLEPAQEADTLAHYFLGFHKLKGIHIISETEFFRLSKYDDRKIDSETENHQLYRYNDASLVGTNNVLLIDEEGKIFHQGSNTGMSEYSANVRLRTVMNRAANRGGR